MEKDGVFVFDLNTPYKHEKVLSGQTFDFDEDDAACRWSNRYDPQTGRVDLSIDIHYKDTGEDFHESFSEYSYPLDTVKALLTRYGFDPSKLPMAKALALSGRTASAGSSQQSSSIHRKQTAPRPNRRTPASGGH